jgi:D-arabinose 1-dehydrogenase-like Zn-dependent alcohol dehydrogenase
VIERVRLVRVGWEAALEHESASEPIALEANHVRVAVEACGVCHRDLLDREGRFPFIRLPITPGHEAVGHVVEAGGAVEDFAVGDRVATMHRDACGECGACKSGQTTLCESAAWVLGILADGGYTSELVVPPSALYRVPESIPATQAAVLHCTLGTAYRDLVTLGHLRAGERVLVTGANGGVGAAGVQIAARLGAEVVAVVRDASHVEFLRHLGAAEVVVDTEANVHERIAPVDIALDAVGAPTFLSALRALKIGGRVVVVGNVTREKIALNLGYLITRGLTVIGGSGATRDDMRAVLELHARTPFEVLVDRTLPLARADEAQKMVRQGGLRGRIVLEPARVETLR